MQSSIFSEETLQEVYSLLPRMVKSIVREYHLPNWRGQEDDVVEDIVQVSIQRALEYQAKVAQGQCEPIQSLLGWLVRTARNYCIDQVRREWRLQRDVANSLPGFTDDESSFKDIAIDNVYNERLFKTVAAEVATFPKGQRLALLADLANRMAFEDRPTDLQAAFQACGMSLEEHRQQQRETARERNCQSAQLNHAYKRLAKLESVLAYAN